MKKTVTIILSSLFLTCMLPINSFSHCQMPCGIYDDEMRIGMINEHIATIEKAMNQIKELEKEGDKNYNQLVRWIVTKENHASELQEIVSQYFMTQRIKPDAKDYSKKLGLLHEMLIYSMKCKQTTDLTYVSKLRDLVKEFQGLYFEKQ
jgi:nickel superoxide dismutase